MCVTGGFTKYFEIQVFEFAWFLSNGFHFTSIAFHFIFNAIQSFPSQQIVNNLAFIYMI